MRQVLVFVFLISHNALFSQNPLIESLFVWYDHIESEAEIMVMKDLVTDPANKTYITEYDQYHFSPFHYFVAIYHNYMPSNSENVNRAFTEMLDYFLANDARFDMRKKRKSNTPLMEALYQRYDSEYAVDQRKGETPFVHFMQKGAQFIYDHKYPFQPIDMIIDYDDVSLIGKLTENGLPLTRSVDGSLSIMEKILLNASPEMIEAILKKGGDVNHRYGQGASGTLDIIMSWRYFEGEDQQDRVRIAGFLIDSGLDVNVRCPVCNRETYLHRAATWNESYEQPSVTRILIDAGADINALDDEGNTPLSWALREKNFEMANFLIQNGADTSITNNNGDSLLAIAQKHKAPPELIQQLQ